MSDQILENIDEVKLLPASKIARFGNYVIDSFGLGTLIFIHAQLIIQFGEEMPDIIDRLLVVYFFVLFILYYALPEYLWGKSLGKFLTKTHVVTWDGWRPSFWVLAVRSLCRLIPLDNVTFLLSNSGWHDIFSKTYVVYDE